MGLRTHVSAHRREFWTRSDQGSAAIEFAFIAPVFFALMLGILEIGVMTFGQFALQNAVIDAGRLIRTGQANAVASLIASGIPVPQCTKDAASQQVTYGNEQDWFKAQICCGVTPLLDCSKLVVTVNAPTTGFGANFNSLQDPALQGSYFKDPATGANNPTGQDSACRIVLIRATYLWTVWFPGLAQILNADMPDKFLVTDGGNGRLLSGTSAFRNEPFTSGVAGC